MNNQNKIVHILCIVMTAMQMYGMQNYTQQEVAKNIPTLQTLAATKILWQLSQDIFAKRQLSNAQYKTLRDQADVYKDFFIHILNHDICDHEQKVVLKKGVLLEAAVRGNHLQMTSLLCALGAQPDTISLLYQDTLLHVAATNGNKRIAKILVRYGIPVDHVNMFHKTPLHFASEKGHEALVRFFLNHGADVDFLEKGDWRPVHSASWHGHEAVVELLLDHGADIDRRGNDGRNPLYCASGQGRTAVVELLLYRGARVDNSSDRSITPLCRASQEGHAEIVTMLLDHGADSNHADMSGHTPLFLASWDGHTPVVEILLRRGARVNHTDNSGISSLYAASLEGHVAAVKLLLDYGAAIDSQDASGCTPLYAASWRKHKSVVELLLQRGADIDCVDTKCQTSTCLEKTQTLRDFILQVSMDSKNNAIDNPMDVFDSHMQAAPVLDCCADTDRVGMQSQICQRVTESQLASDLPAQEKIALHHDACCCIS